MKFDELTHPKRKIIERKIDIQMVGEREGDREREKKKEREKERKRKRKQERKKERNITKDSLASSTRMISCKSSDGALDSDNHLL